MPRSQTPEKITSSEPQQVRQHTSVADDRGPSSNGSVFTTAALTARSSAIVLHGKRILSILVSVLTALIMMEALARLAVTTGHPPLGASPEFDNKCAVAALPVTSENSCIVIGTSLASAGIYSDNLSNSLREKGLDVNVRNLACSGIWPMDQLFLLERALKAGVKPALVICDLTPIALNANGPFAKTHSPAFADSFVGRCESSDQSLQGRLDKLLSRSSFLYAYRSYLKEQLGSIFDRVFRSAKFLEGHFSRSATSEISPHGWAPNYLVNTDDELRQTMVLPKRLKQLADIPRKRFSGHIATYEWAAPIKAYCAKRGIPLAFVWLPVHPVAGEFYAKHLDLSLQDCQKSFEQSVNQADAYFLDLHDKDSDTSHFSDFEHLNAAGAVNATKNLTQALTSPPLSAFLRKGSR